MYKFTRLLDLLKNLPIPNVLSLTEIYSDFDSKIPARSSFKIINYI